MSAHRIRLFLSELRAMETELPAVSHHLCANNFILLRYLITVNSDGALGYGEVDLSSGVWPNGVAKVSAAVPALNLATVSACAESSFRN